jgi:hypothetical protein
MTAQVHQHKQSVTEVVFLASERVTDAQYVKQIVTLR